MQENLQEGQTKQKEPELSLLPLKTKPIKKEKKKKAKGKKFKTYI